MKNRNEYIDTTKALLMILVIIGHLLISTYRTNSIIFKVIYSFHMPAFFMISGMLIDRGKYKKSDWKGYLIKRTKSILAPYLFFELLGAVYHQIIYMKVRPDFIKSIIGIFKLNCNVGANWYLPTYFIASIMYMFTIKCDKRWFENITAAVAFLFVLFFGGKGANYYLIIIARCAIGYVMIILGSKMKYILLCELKGWKIIISGILIVAVSLINGRVDFYYAQVSNPVFFLIGSVSGMYFVLQLSKLIKSKFLNYIGENTIIVLGTHQNIIELVTWFVGQQMSITFFLLELSFIIVIEIIIIKFLNYVCPTLVGKKK